MDSKITIKKTKSIIKPSSLISFLEYYRVKSKDEKITHTSWGKIMGKYSIPDNKLDEFYKLYIHHIRNKMGKLGIIEQHKEVGPIVIDIDLKYDESINDRQYTEDDIKKIVEIYMSEIEKTFVIKNKAECLIAFVFEREKPYKWKDMTKDGIHIMFPYIISEPNAQYVIRDHVIKECINQKMFDDISNKNSIGEIFDRSVIYRNGWFMFESTKPQCEAYRLTRIYDYHGENLTMDDVSHNGIDNIVKFFSIRRFEMKDCLAIRSDRYDEIEKLEKKQATFKINKLKCVNTGSYDVKQISKLVNILSDDRADKFERWIEVGWCLHNTNENDIELLNLWVEFSKKSKKFKDGECQKLWSKFRRDGKLIGLGSLHYWAKQDNPEKYAEIKREDIRYYIDKSLNCTNYDVARVLYSMFKYQFTCASINPKIWYQFRDHKWQEDQEGISLRKKISTELVTEYCKMISYYNTLIPKIESDVNMDDEEKEKEKKKIEDKTKILTNIVVKLKTTTFKDNIMRECRELFYEKDFVNKLDENNYLIGFKNGVYDLQNSEFREGRPEDYISLCTNNYYIEYDESNEYIEDIKEFIGKILPNQHVRKYMLKMLSSMLQGYNAEEKFRIWTGTSSNGKSKLLEIFTLAFGEYCTKLPITLLTGKRAASNAATPEIAQSKGKRVAYLDEPEEGANINVGLMKELSGGDKIKARSLFKEPIEFKPQFKMVLLCNDLPNVPPYDGGTWRRMEVTEFISKFVREPKEDNEYQIDDKLSEKLCEWKEAFMSYLLHYYDIYKKEGLEPPKEVVKFTLEYQQSCDRYDEIIRGIIEPINNKSKMLDIGEIYSNYKAHYGESNAYGKTLTKREFRIYLEKKYGKSNIVNDMLKGFVLKNIEKKNFTHTQDDCDEGEDPNKVSKVY